MAVIGDTEPNSTLEKFNIPTTKQKHGLGLLASVSIAGCDLMSSCLYTASVCASSSGKIAPLGLILVTMMLFLFRKVYSEAVTAIPVNGGTYNIVLNTASKKMAAFVACLSILSYTATAIISAFDAVVYLSLIWTTVDIRLFTIIILIVFAVVTIFGVGESSIVSIGMFVMHMSIVTLLIVWCFGVGCRDGFSLFNSNMGTPYPEIISSSGTLLSTGTGGAAVFFGYCSAMLGITGFESAANYVEEMKGRGTFPQTINWLWFLVGVFNPLLSLVSMMVLSMDEIYAHPSDMLAEMAMKVGGEPFRIVMCVDAVVILCGAVMTGYIGISGLLKRLSNDSVVPQFLAVTNSRDAAYMSIISFLILCVSLFLAIFDPADPTAIDQFGGVYAISFLAVLVAFAVATVFLKLHRPRIARQVISQWWEIFFSGICVAIGLIGNIVLNPKVFILFLIYMAAFVFLISYMFLRVDVFSFGIWMLRLSNLTPAKQSMLKKKNHDVMEAAMLQFDYDELAQIEPVSEEDDHFIHIDFSPHSADLEMVAWDPAVIQRGRRRTDSLVFEQASTKRVSPLAARKSIVSLDGIKERPVLGRVLDYFMTSLDHIVSTPFVILVKRFDACGLQMAMNYINTNELSNNINVVHIVDDRRVMKSKNVLSKRIQEGVESGKFTQEQADRIRKSMLLQMFTVESGNVAADIAKEYPENECLDLTNSLRTLPESIQLLHQGVALLDTFQPNKSIRCMIVRGTFFCPSAVNLVSQVLECAPNNMIMGVPDSKFPFPIAYLRGVRIAVPPTAKESRESTLFHLQGLLSGSNMNQSNDRCQV